MEPIKIVMRIAVMVLFLAAIVFAVRFCTNLFSDSEKGIVGDGNLTRRSITQEEPFRTLKISGSINAYIRQGSPATVEVLADSNLQPYLDFIFEDGVLSIRHKKPLRLSRAAKVLITVPDLERIEVEGAAEIRIPDTLQTENFTLNIKGAAMAELVLVCQNLNTEISGAGEIRLKGKAINATTRINGAGKLAAKEFRINTHDLKINGAGAARTFVTDTLRATVNGAGEVSYSGNPHIIPDINGVGRIKQSH